MTKRMKVICWIITIFVLIIFLRFNHIYNTKDKIDLESKIELLLEDPLNSEKIFEEHGFEVGAENQGLSGYVIFYLDYIYDNRIECSVSSRSNYYVLMIRPIGATTVLLLKLDGDEYSIYDNVSDLGTTLGNENNYSEEVIEKVENHFTKVVNDTYQDYLDTVYSNPIVGRIHFSDMMFKNFILQEGVDFTANKEKS